jgi:asparagine synthase (glutamine-hydrolysing)
MAQRALNMCGISGIVALGAGSPRDLAQHIQRMTDRQAHRGPDSQGVYLDADMRLGLGHNRLSILDLSPAGAQPMANAVGNKVICFNGEVYNFPDLRAEIGSSQTYAGHSDTEVVLAAFEKWGRDSFSRLNGMFAFAILDRAARRVFLVRDRLGIKPLFLARTEGHLLFASEIKGLLASGMVPAAPDFRWLHEYLYFGSTLGENTLYCGVEQLPPGTFIEIDLQTGTVSEPKRYWSANDLPQLEDVDRAAAVETTRELLDKAVARQLASDVPVGAFLSGGVDSTAVVALASRHYGGKLRTYTVGFDYVGDADEIPQARRIAKLFGTEHVELHVAGADIEDVILRLAEAHDQPFADPANLPLFQLCRSLEGQTKVILQGDGGDELFGGYRRYPYLRLFSLWGPLAGALDGAMSLLRGRYGKRVYGAHRFFHALARPESAERMGLLLTPEGPMQPPTAILSPALRALAEQHDPFARYREVAGNLPPLDALQQMLRTDLQILLPEIFLEKVDRATMATSTEVRVPFLDFDLVDYVAALPSHIKVGPMTRKKLLREVLQGLVPAEVLNARKKGFGVPISSWLAGPLRGFAQDRILACAGPDGWFDRGTIVRLFDEHGSGRRDHAQLLWKALQLALWRARLSGR